MLQMSKLILTVFTLAMTGICHEARAADPLPMEPIPKFHGWQALWEQGQKPTDENLVGKWKYAGAGAKESCRNFVLKGKEDEYDPQGIVFTEGRFAELVFEQYGMDMPSGGQVKVLSYKSQNFLGNQGPYKYRSEEPQISFLVKSQSGHSASDTNLTLSCRLVRDKAELLICASKLNLSPTNLWNQQAQMCAAEPVGFFLVWVKNS